jgi:prevent-host-death family protein
MAKPAVREMGVSDARANMTEVIAEVRLLGTPVVLTRRDKPQAVLVSVDWFRQARHDRAKLEAVQDYLDELGTDASKGDVMNIRRVVFETMELAERRALEATEPAAD